MNTTTRLCTALSTLTTAAVLRGQTVVLYVDARASSGGTGTDWAHAYSNLQDALHAASIAGTGAIEIRVAQGVYTPSSQPGMPGFRFPTRSVAGYPVTSAVSFSILGSFGGRSSPTPDARDFVNTRSILTGDVLGDDSPDFGNHDDNIGPVLLLDGRFEGNVVLNGLTVAGGRAGWDLALPGGICYQRRIPPWVERAEVGMVLDRCVIANNFSTRDAGGVGFIGPVRGFLNGCQFENNSGDLAGGASGFIPDVERTVFVANHGRRGGGLRVFLDLDAFPDYPNFTPASSIHECEFYGNHADEEGGGIYADRYFVITTRNSVVASNSAAVVGGGICADRCEVILSTIVNNTSQWSAGLHLRGDSSLVTYSVVWGNRAPLGGQQIGVSQGILQLASVVLHY